VGLSINCQFLRGMTQQTDYPPLKCQRLCRDLSHRIECPCNGVAIHLLPQRSPPFWPKESKCYFRKRTFRHGVFRKQKEGDRVKAKVTDFPLSMSLVEARGLLLKGKSIQRVTGRKSDAALTSAIPRRLVWSAIPSKKEK
jgi:hypothetical protein